MTKPSYYGLWGMGVGLAVLWLVWPVPPPPTLTERQKRIIAQRLHTEIVFGQLLYKLPELVPPAVGYVMRDPRNAAESICEYQLVSSGSPAWRMNVNEPMAAAHFDDFMRDSLPHEIGHLLRCQFDPQWQAHDARWETIVRDLGATPVARHEYGAE